MAVGGAWENGVGPDGLEDVVERIAEQLKSGGAKKEADGGG